MSLSTSTTTSATSTQISIPRFLALSLQLILVFYVTTRWYQIEGLAFQKLALLTWAGFMFHYFLPQRLRLHAFAALSLGSVFVIFGLAQGAWLIGLGLALIGLCHLPVPFAARLGLLAAAVLALALQRSGSLAFPWSSAIWPVLGSMFMLRLIIYVYDLRHRNAPASFSHAVSYFFMIPNVCFPLFPVVDYQSFCRSHYDQKDRHAIYQTGISWILRGGIQLILYRLVYQHLPIDSTAVTDVPQLLRYLLWPFLLYLQVSGLFHMVIGMLHLFGFNLPETHHLFYLSTSFTDFWRRINIYWKDFMMKVFYYPAFFKLRRLGNLRALVLGTFWVFFATWFLHSYQWFWIRGSFLLTWSDTLFWTVLAVLVAIGVVRETVKPARRKLGAAKIPFSSMAVTGLKSLGVFATICVLWSLWISESVVDWASLFGVLGTATAADLWLIPALAAGVAAYVAISIFYQRRPARPLHFWKDVGRNGATVAVLLAVAAPSFYTRLEPETAAVIKGVKSSALNDRDKARRQRDYYEQLNDVGWDNPELMKVYMERPADWGSIRFRPELSRLREGLPYLELVPQAQARHRGTLVTINRWGMRDRDYEKTPAPGTYRIALVGASHTFGSGVLLEENFESLLEERLNREARGEPHGSYEILNFAVEGYSALDVLAELESKVFDFSPASVFYVIHPLDAHLAVERLCKLMDAKVPVPYEGAVAFAARHGVTPGTPEATGRRVLAEHKAELLSWTYHEIAARCQERGVAGVAVFLPILSKHDYDLDAAAILDLARTSGLLTLDLSGVYDGRPAESLHLAPWDDHPNPEGHRLVAARLYDAIRQNQNALRRTDVGQHHQDPGQGVHPQGVPPRRGS